MTSTTLKTVYVLHGDSLGIEYQFDTREEAEAACGSNQWIEEVTVESA